MKNFALIGAAGYVAPKHMKAIKDTGNKLLAAFDIHDSVGILDQYFPDAHFFTEFERFDRFLEKLNRSGIKIDYVSICSPNYLHDSHIRFALRIGANAICEKPMVLNPANAELILKLENESQGKVYNILQLRHHPSIIELKNKIDQDEGIIHDIKLEYVTARGNWYDYSWKGDIAKSGGITSNIGIHFYDMLIWVFGNVLESQIEYSENKRAKGLLRLEKGTVNWMLSIDSNDLPAHMKVNSTRTYRSLKIGNKEFEFSDGFDDLHTKSYESILQGEGFGVKEVLPSLELAAGIRNK